MRVQLRNLGFGGSSVGPVTEVVVPNDKPTWPEVARLQRAIALMPPLPREVFERHRFDGLPLIQIAADLGVDARAVEQLLATAMAHLDSGQD